MNRKVRVSIVGAAGYSGEELIRLLLRHSNIELKFISSRKNNGSHISEVFPRFASTNLFFSSPNIEKIIEVSDIVFLALPHGLAAEYAKPLIKANLKVIDLSADFRLHNLATYKKYYGEHSAPELLPKAIYGAPERNAEKIKTGSLIACPGCYPTSIALPICALLKHKIITPKNIICSSMSGISGAGRKVDLPYIFPECNESVRPYAITGHRHLPEIEQELAKTANLDEIKINFIPHLIPINRGIHSTIIAKLNKNVMPDEIELALKTEYQNAPFVRVLPKGKLADTKNVFYTNVCEIGFAYDEHTGNVIISSAIDNLTKGASGQAIQIMNIMFGFDETLGLI